jgi:hypothetical protein
MMKQPTPPEAVAEQIREIIEGESWQLRYPVGRMRQSRLLGEPGIAMRNGSPCLPAPMPSELAG